MTLTHLDQFVEASTACYERTNSSTLRAEAVAVQTLGADLQTALNVQPSTAAVAKTLPRDKVRTMTQRIAAAVNNLIALY